MAGSSVVLEGAAARAETAERHVQGQAVAMVGRRPMAYKDGATKAPSADQARSLKIVAEVAATDQEGMAATGRLAAPGVPPTGSACHRVLVASAPKGARLTVVLDQRPTGPPPHPARPWRHATHEEAGPLSSVGMVVPGPVGALNIGVVLRSTTREEVGRSPPAIGAGDEARVIA